jgi:ketosteroid isomerase-like protein
MIDQQTAHTFAEEWINAWNSHNLEKILHHYTDDFTMETPMALKLVPESGGVLKGKEAVGAYWKTGLERIPDLFFELHEVLISINGVTLYYTNRATGKRTAEVLFLNEAGKAYKAYAFYN